jgi:hypothetical protein
MAVRTSKTESKMGRFQGHETSGGGDHVAWAARLWDSVTSWPRGLSGPEGGVLDALDIGRRGPLRTPIADAFVPISRWLAEEPRYTVETRLRGVEIRRYPQSARAETHVPLDDFDGAHRDGHRRLLDYAGGANGSKAHGANDGERLAATVPLLCARSRLGGFRFTLLMPRDRDLSSLPPPRDGRIRLREVGEQLVAVKSYRGSFGYDPEREEDVVTTLADLGLMLAGVPSFAAYDPPSALPSLRRNEIWVPIITAR